MERYKKAGIEPTIEDLLTDPLTHMIMSYDNVNKVDIAQACQSIASSHTRRAMMHLSTNETTTKTPKDNAEHHIKRLRKTG